MLPQERRSRIQDLFGRKSTVTIAELARTFLTSEMTIRRDLDELEARGVCQRIHGGAISLRVQESRAPAYPPYRLREQRQVREKVAIGRAAAALVRPGDVIAIDAGTTAAYLALALRNTCPLTVITNSLRVMDQLYDGTNVTVICPGGILSIEDRTLTGGDLAFVGPLAVLALRNFRPQKAFIGTSGITVADGISNAGLFQAEIKRTLIEIAEEAILLTDRTKFGQVLGFLVAGAPVFKKIITDTLAPPQDVEALRSLGIEVILVEPAGDAPTLLPAIVAGTGEMIEVGAHIGASATKAPTDGA